ncbi:MAG: hypothetical protein NZ602_15185, partial [Thermoguttaceae bacterium]|nr:hypothetical protein [Thermoguttaceae bacterium]
PLCPLPSALRSLTLAPPRERVAGRQPGRVRGPSLPSGPPREPWIPAFAGMTPKAKPGKGAYLSEEARLVIPAQAGIQKIPPFLTR